MSHKFISHGKVENSAFQKGSSHIHILASPGIPLPDQLGGDGGDLLAALHLPPHRRHLRLGRLAGDAEQVVHRVGDDLRQEGEE